MRKAFLILASLLTLVAVTPATASAATDALAQKTTVTGFITNNGKAVKNAGVTVICNNNALYATTDKTGLYSVTFKKGKCPVGATANVTAAKNKLGGVSQTKVIAGTAKLNVAIVNVAVPEFGLITGVTAAVLGGGALLYARRNS
jgi:hypothetical protein